MTTPQTPQTPATGVDPVGETGGMEVTIVYGALRSGSTVFRLMLNAHPRIQNPGEFDFLFDYLYRRPDGSWSYDVAGLESDWVYTWNVSTGACALPDGYDEASGDGVAALRHMMGMLRGDGPGAYTFNLHRNLHIAAQALPDLRVIRLLRDPRDVARSAMMMGWAGTLWHGAKIWETAEDGWDAAAPYLSEDRVLTMRYEDLIADFESNLRTVCAFLGEPFDAAMLTYYEGTTYGAPDPKLIEQWRHRSTPQELALIEYRLGSRLASRGYQPSGHTPRGPSGLETLRMKFQDVLWRWRYGIKAHGAATFFGEMLTRRLRLNGPHERLLVKMGETRRELVR